MALIRPNAEPAATSVAGGDIFLIDGATGVRALAASLVPIRDANTNVALNNSILGYTTTATAAATTTLTAASTWAQYFTGATTQIVVLPVVSTLALDHSFYIQNSSTGALTVNSSGGNLVTTVAAGASALVSCILITGTTAASWSAKYHAALVASGKVLTVNNTLTLAGTDGTTMTFPGTSATIARTDAGQTFTGTQTIGALVATTVNGNTITTGTGVLTIAAAKTLTANNTLTLAGADGKTLTVSNSLTLAGTDGKTLTVSNTLGLAGTDGTTMTFPTTSATIARTDAANTFTGTQTIGALVATTVNGNTITTGTGVLTIAAAKTLTANNTLTLAGTDGKTLTVSNSLTLAGTDGKTLTVSNTLGLAGTDGTTMTFPTTSATIARTDAANTFTGTQTIGALVATTVNGNTITTGTGVLTLGAAKTLTVSNTLTLAGTDATTLTFQGTDTYVGRATTDTLTNKTINGASNTLTVRAASDITGTLPVANGGTNYTGGAWTAYTATVTPGAGAITTQSSASSFLQIGKLVHVRISVTVSNIGTASGLMGVNLPVASAAGATQNLWGRESAISGSWISGTVNVSGTNLDIRTSANASFTYTNNMQIVFVGVYEAA